MPKKRVPAPWIIEEGPFRGHTITPGDFVMYEIGYEARPGVPLEMPCRIVTVPDPERGGTFTLRSEWDGRQVPCCPADAIVFFDRGPGHLPPWEGIIFPEGGGLTFDFAHTEEAQYA